MRRGNALIVVFVALGAAREISAGCYVGREEECTIVRLVNHSGVLIQQTYVNGEPGGALPPGGSDDNILRPSPGGAAVDAFWETGIGENRQRMEWHLSLRGPLDACSGYIVYLTVGGSWRTGGSFSKPCRVPDDRPSGGEGGSRSTPPPTATPSRNSGATLAEADRRVRAEAERQRAEAARQRLESEWHRAEAQRLAALRAEQEERARQERLAAATREWTEAQRRAEEARRAAIAAVQEEQRKRQQEQLELLHRQQAAMAAGREAAMQGAEEGRQRAERENRQRREGMVRSAVSAWQPPKRLAATSSSAVSLVDPFAPKTPAGPGLPVSKSMEALLAVVEGSCLAIDQTLMAAMVVRECLQGARKGQLQVGDYPVDQDGKLLTSIEKIRTFRNLLTDPRASYLAIRQGRAAYADLVK